MSPSSKFTDSFSQSLPQFQSCGIVRKRRATGVTDLTGSDMKTSSVGGRLRILDAPLGAAANVYGIPNFTDLRLVQIETNCRRHFKVHLKWKISTI